MAVEVKGGNLRTAAYQVLRQRIAEAIALGRIGVEDPDLVAQLLWTGLHGVLHLTTGGANFPFLAPSQLIPSMIDTLLAGMARAPVKAGQNDSEMNADVDRPLLLHPRGS